MYGKCTHSGTGAFFLVSDFMIAGLLLYTVVLVNFLYVFVALVVRVVTMGLRVMPRYVMGPISPGEGPLLSGVVLRSVLVKWELLYCSFMMRLDGK